MPEATPLSSQSVKHSWRYAALGDVCVTSSGGTPLKLDSTNYDGGTIPWLMSGEVGRRDVTAATKVITDKGLARSSAKLFPPSSVLVAMYGATAGEVGILRFEAATNQAVCGIMPSDTFLPEFIYYFLLAKQQQLVSTATGNAQPNISQAKIRALSVPVLAHKEQGRIVAILDEAFEGIANAEQNTLSQISDLAAVFASELDSTLSTESDGWKTATLNDVCQIARGGSPRPIEAFLTDSTDGINWVKISDATASAKYIYKTEQRIVPAGAKRSRMVHDGDFLLSNSMSFGRPYIMKTDGCIHDGWLVLSDYQKSFDQDFLYLLLGSGSLYRQFDRLAAGSTVRNLNKELASRVIVRFPNLERQRVLAKNLEHLLSSLEDMKAILKKKVTALFALRQSFLHQAFSGKL